MRPGKLLFYVLLVSMPIAAILGSLYFEYRPCERIKLGSLFHENVQREHVARYAFAKQYCEGKTVADIASGTGYGMDILRTVAASVDGYDKEDFGNNYLIDLEEESWGRNYDVIVSFETIEHLANPRFFLENARRTCKLLLLSAPVNEEHGNNPYHKQFWNATEFQNLVGEFFACEFFEQRGTEILRAIPQKQAVAVCVPKDVPR